MSGGCRGYPVIRAAGPSGHLATAARPRSKHPCDSGLDKLDRVGLAARAAAGIAVAALVVTGLGIGV